MTTHSGSSFNLDNKDYTNLTRIEKEYLEQYFPFENNDHRCYFKIERKLGNENLKILSEYAFLIFKELSIELNEDWMILKYMKEKNTEHNRVDGWRLNDRQCASHNQLIDMFRRAYRSFDV